MELPCDKHFSPGSHVDLKGLEGTGDLAGLLTDKGFIKVMPRTGATAIDGVFAGGDAVRTANVITAIAAGRRVAVSMDKYMRGDKDMLEYTENPVTVNTDDVLKRVGYLKRTCLRRTLGPKTAP